MKENTVSVYGIVTKVNFEKRIVSGCEMSCTSVTLKSKNRYSLRHKSSFFTFTGLGDNGDRFARDLNKGFSVYVNGTLQPHTYTNRNGEVAVDLHILDPEVIVVNGNSEATDDNLIA